MSSNGLYNGGMDLLDRINALTDDQLRMVAERDDASGVLASYRLAQLRGLPYPDREAAILGDGYVIVAQAGKIMKLPVESVDKIIRQEGGEYCVYSEDGSRSFGCYPTMEDAESRLRQIHVFRAVLREGSFVSWNSSGGRARGQIEYVMQEGVLGVPGSDFSITAEPDDPAVLIRIWRRGSEGWAATETLVGHKMSTLTPIEALSKEPDAEVPDALSKQTFSPPEGVQEAAQRALDWIAEGYAGGGFTDVGRARASQLARGDGVSEDTIRRMSSYLARHEGDSGAEGFNAGEDGFPSPGRVAWDAWGGDPAVSWVRDVIAGLESEEKQYEPDDMMLTPRQKMMYEKYEWVADTFGAWDGGIGPDGAHYIPAEENVFSEKGINCANCVFYQGGGGCEILNMPVEPEGACKLWIIPETRVEESVVKRVSNDGRFLRKEAHKRFTLGPLYVPDFMDAHGEWTDAQELQQAVWEWVKGGDRTIYLQHDRDVRAGEWVEVMTMPQPWTVDMLNGAGESIGKITYPAGTVFLGVMWDQGPWEQILRGELRGYSIGGFSDRVLADLPEDASRDGIELEQEPSLAKSIADAVALAMQQTQPVVNVVMPEQGKAKVRRIERDEHGNISRIIEEDE
jgi:hypothetical protein